MSCANPGCGCQAGPYVPCGPATIDASKEPLASALDNFVASFYGAITKSVVNGAVVWTLPCNLDTGLPGNPRLSSEGLACYFLRLFADGIKGLKGDPGVGLPGASGISALGSVAVAFATPSTASPVFVISASNVSWVSAGQTLYIAGLGYASVDAITGGILALRLVVLSSSAGASVPAGALIAPAGPRGASGPVGYVRTTAAFTAPAISANVAASLDSTEIILAGMRLFVEGSGYYTVVSSSTASAVLQYNTAVASPLAIVPAGSKVIPS